MPAGITGVETDSVFGVRVAVVEVEGVSFLLHLVIKRHAMARYTVVFFIRNRFLIVNGLFASGDKTTGSATDGSLKNGRFGLLIGHGWEFVRDLSFYTVLPKAFAPMLRKVL